MSSEFALIFKHLSCYKKTALNIAYQHFWITTRKAIEEDEELAKVFEQSATDLI